MKKTKEKSTKKMAKKEKKKAKKGRKQPKHARSMQTKKAAKTAARKEELSLARARNNSPSPSETSEATYDLEPRLLARISFLDKLHAASPCSAFVKDFYTAAVDQFQEADFDEPIPLRPASQFRAAGPYAPLLQNDLPPLSSEPYRCPSSSRTGVTDSICHCPCSSPSRLSLSEQEATTALYKDLLEEGAVRVSSASFLTTLSPPAYENEHDNTRSE
jgi:hypothetical protein